LTGARTHHLLYDADTISQDSEEKLYEELKVIWRFWEKTQSFHGSLATVDLGEID
jgi:hypothetical protein